MLILYKKILLEFLRNLYFASQSSNTILLQLYEELKLIRHPLSYSWKWNNILELFIIIMIIVEQKGSITQHTHTQTHTGDG